jgi:hypothetical protein
MSKLRQVELSSGCFLACVRVEQNIGTHEWPLVPKFNNSPPISKTSELGFEIQPWRSE